MQGKILLILLFALIVAIFAIQNANLVLIRIFTWQYEISLIYIILGAVALGVIIMGIFSSLRQLRLKRKLRSARSEIKKLEEINQVMEERINNLKEERVLAGKDSIPAEYTSKIDSDGEKQDDEPEFEENENRNKLSDW